ncbi:ATP-binding response regulator [Paraburkholderia bryophila]|uniref:histidine kinase n=1 Tax=Paraburkholderia bryophila TaxID=420952 RepID=A0A7Y9WQ98_9BURK|nr:ATP-binding protein [Paraburkholderia bryophila]NYH24196.1 PAS domain S-box-containing protein [Paraburkholderia bryophila]
MESATELNERLALAIEAAEIGTFYVPVPMKQIYWNAKCAEHFWVHPDAEVDFELFYSRLHPDDRERTRAAVEAAVFDGTGYDIEYRALSPAGEIRWIRAKGRPRYDDAGQPVRFDGITIDISAQKRLERERNRLLEHEQLLRRDAELANALKDTFIATVSHELRTPLTAIQMWTELLERRVGEPAFVSHCIAVIRRNIASQTRLVDDLLDTGRIAAGKLEIHREDVLPAHVLEVELQAIEPLAAHRNINIVRRLGATAFVSGDRQRLRQVFGNILSNALRYTAPSGTVTVSVWEENNEVKVCVADTGEGIPAPFLDRIFTAFEQVDGSTTRRHGGLGLGLAIARKLVVMHGGTIIAESDGPGLGSRFTVTLPTIVSAMPPDDASVGTDSVSVSSGNLSVLLVDDDVDSLEALSLILRHENLTVYAAASAQDAREILARHTVDAIFSDISMPDEDGYQFVASLRNNGIKTPAFALTAFAREEDRLRAHAAGFDGHIGKPVESSKLVTLLASVVLR